MQERSGNPTTTASAAPAYLTGIACITTSAQPQPSEQPPFSSTSVSHNTLRESHEWLHETKLYNGSSLTDMFLSHKASIHNGQHITFPTFRCKSCCLYVIHVPICHLTK